ncbi:MAG: hypothetical protein PHT53_03170, partial [Candidatus Omnitrophica bacterium]|nr:hypothetical protein [Candidatus Omnitrophota bacterium]
YLSLWLCFVVPILHWRQKAIVAKAVYALRGAAAKTAHAPAKAIAAKTAHANAQPENVGKNAPAKLNKSLQR